jgi:hypothetical protein
LILKGGDIMNIEIALTPDEVEKITREYLQKKFKTVNDIKIVVGKELRGQSYDEHYETVFKGIKADVEL